MASSFFKYICNLRYFIHIIVSNTLPTQKLRCTLSLLESSSYQSDKVARENIDRLIRYLVHHARHNLRFFFLFLVRIFANWKSSYIIIRFRTVTQVFNQDQSAMNFHNTFQLIIDAIILQWNASYKPHIHYFALDNISCQLFIIYLSTYH